MRRLKLPAQEKEIEEALINDQFVNVTPEEFHQIAQSLAARKKDAVLNVRINSQDLRNIKEKARKMGVKYQTFISELLHRVATN
ncbi:MAG TPA: hypothetical protein P5110_01280 [Candidatus Omnitrophota bacterium]|nr:hypothetical protein [Candidatus Omnitrophota bacterium]HRZ14118.1 hypothetical protein [Candidatus Omnitrophota bacterium]